MTPTGRLRNTWPAVGLVACAGALALVGVLTDRASAGEKQPQPTETAVAPADATDPVSLPRAGVLRFGEDFGGVAIGASRADVLEAWGPNFGACRSCRTDTWYFTYEAFTPQGAGVEFVDGRVQALFTLWQPAGWRSAGGLALGTPLAEIPSAYLELSRVECAGYDAYVHERGDTNTVLYVHEDVLWAFGLMAIHHPVCR